ncbi:hypothetical protein ABVK25_002714 [Lepraria finkii]|uniref:Uncharacterized protein n=1 Tax=Lepraria finkii TaxID=1340010 RepID=A0ABR4BGM3_9LECA
MASNETSFAMIDELQAKLAEFERLEATFKERDTTISNLKAFGAALHKSYDSEGNETEASKYSRVTTHMTPATFTPILTEKILSILQKGDFGAKPILVAFSEGEETGKIFVPVPKGEALKVMMTLGEKEVGGGEA